MRAISCVPFFKRRRLWTSGFLKEVNPCFKIVCNVCGGLLFGDVFGLNIDKGLPETRSPYRKPNEPGNARRCLQPTHDPVSLCTASQHTGERVLYQILLNTLSLHNRKLASQGDCV
jgi:hypothetical protein